MLQKGKDVIVMISFISAQPERVIVITQICDSHIVQKHFLCFFLKLKRIQLCR